MVQQDEDAEVQQTSDQAAGRDTLEMAHASAVPVVVAAADRGCEGAGPTTGHCREKARDGAVANPVLG